MKKIVSILVGGLLILSLTACGGSNITLNPNIEVVKSSGTYYRVYTYNGYRLGNSEIEKTEDGGYVVHIYVQPESAWKTSD